MGGKRERAAYISQSSIRDADEELEQDNEPGLGIKKGFNHLFPLEFLILHSRLVRAEFLDMNRFLPLCKKGGFEGIVW